MITSLEQGSEAWLDWRRSGIGASDSHVISVNLPSMWKSVYDLWKEKTSSAPVEPFTNEAIEKGRRLEPLALQWYNNRFGVLVESPSLHHKEMEFVRASLDGLYGRYLVEVKCGEKVYQNALKGRIAGYYYAQVQHQLAVVNSHGANIEYAHFLVYLSDEETVLFKVYNDLLYQVELANRWRIFWDYVQREQPLYDGNLGMKMNPSLGIPYEVIS